MKEEAGNEEASVADAIVAYASNMVNHLPLKETLISIWLSEKVRQTHVPFSQKPQANSSNNGLASEPTFLVIAWKPARWLRERTLLTLFHFFALTKPQQARV